MFQITDPQNQTAPATRAATRENEVGAATAMDVPHPSVTPETFADALARMTRNAEGGSSSSIQVGEDASQVGENESATAAALTELRVELTQIITQAGDTRAHAPVETPHTPPASDTSLSIENSPLEQLLRSIVNKLKGENPDIVRIAQARRTAMTTGRTFIFAAGNHDQNKQRQTA
jgi:hypothetical protein